MLWPVVLPLKITMGVWVVLLVLVALFAPSFKWQRRRAITTALILGCIAFIPSCTGIMKVLDQYRFGVFQYETAADVKDVRAKRWLPMDAKSVTLEQESNGFRASFSISQTDLDDHFDDQWKRYGDRSVSERSDSVATSPTAVEALELEFGGLRWQIFNDMIEYRGPVASNGAGYSIWYSPSQAIGYQSGGYW